MLDIQVWCEEGAKGEQLLHHSYYEKPVTSPLVLMEKSALPARSKMVVLTQELLRRMKNTSPRVDPQERVDILSGVQTLD